MSKIWIIVFLRKKWMGLINRIRLSGYNNETISSYFAKQGATIGENCIFQIRTLGHEPYLVTIGNHVFIAAGATLHTHDGGVWVLRNQVPDISVFGRITIEDNCMIGTNSQIFPNVTVGKNSIVGAGSIVISDIPPNSIAMGNPARVLGSVEKYEEKCLKKWFEQKPPDFVSEKHYGSWYKNENVKKLRSHLKKVLFSDIEHKRFATK